MGGSSIMSILEILWLFTLAVILVGLYGQYTKSDPTIISNSKILTWWGLFGIILLIVVEIIIWVIFELEYFL